MRRVCRLGGYKLADLTHAAMISYGRKLNDACVGWVFSHTLIRKRNRGRDAYVLWKWHTPLL